MKALTSIRLGIFFALLAVFCTCQVGVGVALAADSDSGTPMIATITQLQGGVFVQKGEGAALEPAKRNEILSAGDRVETTEDGLAQITIENGNRIDLKPSSNLTLSELMMNRGQGTFISRFYSTEGKIRAQVRRMSGDSVFEVKTPVAVASVRGTVMFLTISRQAMQAAFFDGMGQIQNLISGRTQIVGDGEEAILDSEGNVSESESVSDEDYRMMTQGWSTQEQGQGSLEQTGRVTSPEGEPRNESERLEGSEYR